MSKDDSTTKEVDESTPSNDSKATEEVTETSKEKGSTVPYDRFHEVVEQKNDFAKRYDVLETQLAERQGELGQMVDLLDQYKSDSDLVNQLRVMAKDPKWKEILETVDKGLKGEDPEEPEEAAADDKGDKPQAKADNKTKELLSKTREDMENLAAEQQADLLLMKVNMLAEKYFDALPDQYIEVDKKIISELLVNKIDWDGIEENPDSLNETVAKGFESTLEHYGTPRGIVAEEESEGKETTEAKGSEESGPEYLKTNWGELKEVKTPDGTTLQPVQSEEDFREALAQSIRDSRGT